MMSGVGVAMCIRCNGPLPTGAHGMCELCQDQVLDETLLDLEVGEVFKRARLLVRTTARVRSDGEWVWGPLRAEMRLHCTSGFVNCSTSLLLPRVRQSLYRATGNRFGFLYNADSATEAR